MLYNKSANLMVKGYGILLMILFHVLDFPEDLGENMYISIYTLNSDTPIEKIFASYGNICVALFSFLSGYGLYLNLGQESFINKYKVLFNKAKKLGFILLFYLIPFSILGFIFSAYELPRGINIQETLIDVLFYNATWWFFYLYLLFLVITPLVFRLINDNYIVNLCLFVVVFFLSQYFLIKKIDGNVLDIYKYFPSFFLGVIFCKHNWINKIISKLDKYPFSNKHNLLTVLLVLFFTVIIRDAGTILIRPSAVDPFLCPIIICFISWVKNKKIKDFLIKNGKQSLGMWLIHGYFTFYYLQYIGYFPRFSILCFIWIVCISYLISLFIDKLLKRCYKVIFNSI